ncbi:BON domain-containing protein [Actinokineospora globicatena]|uniref:BON domain-containing protein n=1 Tax=Actinokineospora globicatena TaxID=103729 RepID=UPI0020A32830|nr:BON domain-containing protein [Actinokineospora globicatena]MCP2303358.1 BON domain-containing protein [Actinokineospora globicatena]GLW79509.1 hypothetical protein Aglo01_39910 [Actinokineospora globicatena]GLW86081.1 hypothetical protein Aglo02_37200 [Actinokineospora globicatena]
MTTTSHCEDTGHRSDQDILDEIEDVALPSIAGVDTSLVRAAVDNGRVLLVGRLDWDSQAPLVGHVVAGVPGVVAVANRIRCTWDDVTRFPRHPHLPRLWPWRC